MSQITKPSFALLTLTLAVSCASVPQGDVPSTANPKEEITRLDEDISDAISLHHDVLAPSDFKKVDRWQDEAKSDLASGESQEEILNDVRRSRVALKDAYQTSRGRESKVPGLLLAREKALEAGANIHPEIRDDMRELDNKVSRYADDLDNVKADRVAELQSEYVDIERRSVIATQLGESQAILNGAKKDEAEDLAPKTYKRAELSVKNAESMISSNVNSPGGFESAVMAANRDALLLMEVMRNMKQNKGISEAAALKIVAQDRKIGRLQSNLYITDAALATASVEVSMQRAIEAARSRFSEDEAEAYQQGDKLVIRMKNMQFANGRADLPGQSINSLAKISEVAHELNAEEIKVEGHTDSVGGAKLNKKLSQSRANSVATYFKSNGFETTEAEGYGFSKPISSNKTKAGRAQNRRVDIIITPGATPPAEDRAPASTEVK